MAAKVALTAEEFRENSQRSIALFNTEKLSTDSTHVLKSAYCNSVHFCRCNLHGACGGKVKGNCSKRSSSRCNLHGACGGKEHHLLRPVAKLRLQSARGVWRQSLLNLDTDGFQRGCNLHGACGGKGESTQMVSASRLVAICTGRVEAKVVLDCYLCDISVAICTGRVEAKGSGAGNTVDARSCNLHGACGGKGALQFHPYY